MHTRAEEPTQVTKEIERSGLFKSSKVKCGLDCIDLFSGRSGVTLAIRHSLFTGSRCVMCIKLVPDTSFAAPLSHKRGCCMYVYVCIKNSIFDPKSRIILNTRSRFQMYNNISVLYASTQSRSQ